MIIEFYLTNGDLFMREMPIPLPDTYRIHKPSKPITGILLNDKIPPIMDEDYMLFELATIRYKYHPMSNVVGLPRKAYREIKR